MIQNQVCVGIEPVDRIESSGAKSPGLERVSMRSSAAVRICAIIPAYNEAESIAEVISRTKPYVDKVFVIDDCSSDDTAEVAKMYGAEVIKHSVNGGPGVALQSGCDAAIGEGFDYIVQVDGDGQHDPKHIPQMISLMRECDIVIGSRFLNDSYRHYPFIRRLGIRFFSWIVNLIGKVGITDVTSGYRLYKAEALKQLSRIEDRHWAVAQTLEAAKKGLKIREISTEMPVRRKGKSQFSIARYGFYPLKMIPVVVKASLAR